MAACGAGHHPELAPDSVLIIDMAERFDAFAASDAAMAKSGTVTLELALADVPMVVAYRISPPPPFSSAAWGSASSMPRW